MKKQRKMTSLKFVKYPIRDVLARAGIFNFVLLGLNWWIKFDNDALIVLALTLPPDCIIPPSNETSISLLILW